MCVEELRRGGVMARVNGEEFRLLEAAELVAGEPSAHQATKEALSESGGGGEEASASGMPVEPRQAREISVVP
jgi:hypothetical protein